MQITTTMADLYFSLSHLSTDTSWSAISEADKTVLLYNSESEIKAVLGLDEIYFTDDEATGVEDFTPLMKAIFEWALYRYTNAQTIQSGLNVSANGLKRRRVDGMGEEEYDSSYSVSVSSTKPLLKQILGSPAGVYIRAAVGPMTTIN